MALDIVVHHADLIVMGNDRWWALVVEWVEDGTPVVNDNGVSIQTHMMPEDIIETYLAKYDLPATPGGMAEALELVLYEPTVEWSPADEDMNAIEAPDALDAVRFIKTKTGGRRGNGQVRGRKGDAAHLRTIGGGRTLLGSGVADPVEFLLSESPVDDVLMSEKKAHYDGARRDAPRRREERRLARLAEADRTQRRGPERASPRVPSVPVVVPPRALRRPRPSPSLGV